MYGYKLTTQECTTGPIRWIKGEWHTATGSGVQLCSPDYLHCYPSALGAMFLNPIHARIPLPRLWKCEYLGATKEDAGLKLGAKQMRVIEELLPPILDQEHRIRLALLVSLEACGNPAWRSYATNYLTKPDVTYTEDKHFIEPEAERIIRQYAYKACGYEEVEWSSALAVQTACQYKQINIEALYVQAWGRVYIDTTASGRTLEGQAFRSAPHD